MVIFQKFLTSFTSILTFLSFSYSERFLYTQEHIGAICLFFLQKDFDIFHALLFDAFLCVFDNIYLPFLYLEKKFYKIYFFNFLHNSFVRIFFISIFFIRTFFTIIFFSRIFSVRIRRNFYTSIIYNILRNLFFFNNILILY